MKQDQDDFHKNLDNYLAMYRGVPVREPYSETLMKVTASTLWLVVVVLWGVIIAELIGGIYG